MCRIFGVIYFLCVIVFGFFFSLSGIMVETQFYKRDNYNTVNFCGTRNYSVVQKLLDAMQFERPTNSLSQIVRSTQSSHLKLFK